MKIVGLTGGIATGKSTVSRLYRQEFGVVVVDADVISRQVVAPGTPAFHRIADEFGPDVVLPNGHLNRERLGAVVFANPAKRRALNAITHPAIFKETLRQLLYYYWHGHGVVVLDAPLLLESKLAWMCHSVIVVAAPETTQLARAQGRDGLSQEAAEARVRAQMPLAAKLRQADVVVHNHSTLEHLHDEAVRGFRKATAARFPFVHCLLPSTRYLVVSVLAFVAALVCAPVVPFLSTPHNLHAD